MFESIANIGDNVTGYPAKFSPQVLVGESAVHVPPWEQRNLVLIKSFRIASLPKVGVALDPPISAD